MKSLIEYFDRTYIINLRDRPDRRRETETEFRRIGMEIPANKIQFFTTIRPATRANFPSLGARGSYTSHRDVLDLALRNSLNNVLVFEDDISFLTISKSAIGRILLQLSQKPWDIVYFGYGHPRLDDNRGTLLSWSEETIGGHFYAVNGQFIGEMSRYMHECESRPPEHPLGGPTFRDGAYNNIRRLRPEIRTLLAVPSLATQRSSRTDLHPLKLYDRLKFMRGIMRALRYLKNRAHRK